MRQTENTPTNCAGENKACPTCHALPCVVTIDTKRLDREMVETQIGEMYEALADAPRDEHYKTAFAESVKIAERLHAQLARQELQDAAWHNRPPVVCLCGSTRFTAAFEKANHALTLAGCIVLSIGSHRRCDESLGLTQEQKDRLDALHLQKVAIADHVHILNVGGYIGHSTGLELAEAIRLGKTISYLEP